jgi:hypothetical protein
MLTASELIPRPFRKPRGQETKRGEYLMKVCDLCEKLDLKILCGEPRFTMK